MADEESSLDNYVNDSKYNLLTEEEFIVIAQNFSRDPQNAITQMRLNIEQSFVQQALSDPTFYREIERYIRSTTDPVQVGEIAWLLLRISVHMSSDFIAESYDRLSEWLASRVQSLYAYPDYLEYVLIYLNNIIITVSKNKIAALNIPYEMYNGFSLSSVAWTCEQHPQLYPSYLDLINSLWLNDSKMHLENLTGSILGCGILDCDQRLQNHVVMRKIRFAKAVLLHVGQGASA